MREIKIGQKWVYGVGGVNHLIVKELMSGTVFFNCYEGGEELEWSECETEFRSLNRFCADPEPEYEWVNGYGTVATVLRHTSESLIYRNNSGEHLASWEGFKCIYKKVLKKTPMDIEAAKKAAMFL